MQRLTAAQKCEWGLMILYTLLGLGTGIWNIFHSTVYYVFLAFVSPLLLLIPFAVDLVFKLKPAYSMHLLIHIFLWMAFMGGMVYDGYIRWPLYDKITHMMSGVLFAVIGICVYYFFKRRQEVHPSDYALVSYFAVSFAMASSVIWEIYEYLFNFIFPTDPQHVLDTGINDTMQDMIACLLGALIVWGLIAIHFKRKKRMFIMQPVEEFVEKNLSETSPHKAASDAD